MPQQLLDYSHVHAAVERVRREGMAQQMRVNVFFQSRPLADRADNALNGTRLERLVRRFAAAEKPITSLPRHEILLDHQPRTNREVDHAVLVAFARYFDRASDQIQIGGTQLRDLTQTAAGRNQKFDERFLAVAFASVAQAFLFFHGQRLPCALFVQLE